MMMHLNVWKNWSVEFGDTSCTQLSQLLLRHEGGVAIRQFL